MGMKCLLMEYLMSNYFLHICFNYGVQEDEDFDVSYSTLYMYFNVAAIYIF